MSENIIKIKHSWEKGMSIIINGATFFSKMVFDGSGDYMMCEGYTNGNFDIIKMLPHTSWYDSREINLFLEALAYCTKNYRLDKRTTTVETYSGNKIYLLDLLKLIHNQDAMPFVYDIMFVHPKTYSITIKDFRRFYSDTGVKCILSVNGKEFGGIIAVDSDHIGWWIIESEFENRSDIPKRCWSIGCKNGWEAIVEYVRHYFVDVLGLNIYDLEINFDRDGGLIHNFDGDISITDEALELLIKTGANL